MSLAATGAQAQETANICDRTPLIRDWILQRTPAKDTCDSVLISQMASILQGLLIFDEERIGSLKPGDLDGLDQIPSVNLNHHNLTELPSGLFSGVPNIDSLQLNHNSLSALPSGIFSGLSKLLGLTLHNNRLNTLPAGIFSGLTSLFTLSLENNPGAPFRFTVRFDPETLDEDFTDASVKLVLREGAPRQITVSLGVVGATLSADSLSLAKGDTESDEIMVTRNAGGERFALIQRKLELGGSDRFYTGFTIIRGPSILVGDPPMVRVKVFLEGALE